MKPLKLFGILVGLALTPVASFGLPPGKVVLWGLNLIDVNTRTTGSQTTNGVITINGNVLDDATAISAGPAFGLALKSDGTVVGWGNNISGQATGTVTPYPHETNGPVALNGQRLQNVTAISAGGFGLALKRDGSIRQWGDASITGDQTPTDISSIISIAAGWNYGMALRKDGTVAGWGIRKVPEGLSNIVAIAAGKGPFGPSLALRKDGAVIDWSPGADYEKGSIVASNATAIAAGVGHELVLKSDGTVFGWGDNRYGEATGIPNTDTKTSYISSGLVTLGGQVLSNVVAIAAGEEFSVALKLDGKVVAWGKNFFHETDVPAGLSNVVAIAAGNNFCLAITTNIDARNLSAPVSKK